ncbi:MAG: hypothetical protein HC868_17285 [Sphingomonadales bacterium]|nr:hypothetical protein [Sphingomonadales bacterium]
MVIVPGALRVALISRGTMRKVVFRVGLAAVVAAGLSGCGTDILTPAMRPLPKETMMLLGKKA